MICESCGATSYLPFVSNESKSMSNVHESTEDGSSSGTPGFSGAEIRAIEAKLKTSTTQEEFARIWQDFRVMLDSWSDSQIHSQKIQVVHQAGTMPLFAAGYKAVLDICPDDVEAQKGQARIIALAMQSVQGENQNGDNEHRLIRGLALVTLFVLFCCALWFLWQILSPADAS